MLIGYKRVASGSVIVKKKTKKTMFTEAAMQALTGFSTRKVKWAILRVPQGKDSGCDLEKVGYSTGNDDADFRAFAAAVPESEPRWLVYDLHFMKRDINNNKIVFIQYVPDTCTKLATKF